VKFKKGLFMNLKKFKYAVLGCVLINSRGFCQMSKMLGINGAAQAASVYNYGMGGCGLGSLLFEGPAEQNQRFFQAAASIINNYFFPQTFAISSGTSNCQEISHNQAALEQEVYVAVNKRHLEKETSQAAGPHLKALAQVLGCEDHVVQEFGAVSQKSYSQLFAADEPKSIAAGYRAVVLSSGSLSEACHRVL